MGQMFRLYIKCEHESSLEMIRARYPTALIESPSLFASATVETDEYFRIEDGERISQELEAEIIYLAFSSVTDSFQFTHCMHGKTLRHLRYGMFEQGLWEEVAGPAEPWETEAFFPDSATKFLADFDPGNPDYERLSEIYGRRIVSVSKTHPMIDARESARTAAMYYRLTDWLDDWSGNIQEVETDQQPAPQEVLSGRASIAAPRWRFWR